MAAGAAQRHSLGRDIAWVLAVKFAALVALYVLFFGPSHHVAVTPARVAAVIIGPESIHEVR
jgi:hypothetical protein